MTGAAERIAVFGTPEVVPGPLRRRAGRLSLEISGGAARGIAWGGTEVLRGLDCPVRDEGWGTYPPEDPAMWISPWQPVRDSLRAVASSAQRSGVAPRRVIALPEAYLRSYQPTDPIPPGPTPRGAAKAARIEFPQALIGGGALTHFTEFNRCRPDVAACDYVTHGTAAIFHAADDRSAVARSLLPVPPAAGRVGEL